MTAIIAAVIGVLGLGYLWLRQSSLVGIKQVQVTGLNGPNVSQIRAALVNSALTMTSLDASVTKLDKAVAGYPNVYAITISTHFPHGLSITVVEHRPVAVIQAAGRREEVDGTGLLLPDRTGQLASLPLVPLRYEPGGAQVQTAGALAAIDTLQAAPFQLLSHIQSATSTSAHGVVLQLRNGPQLFFGPDQQLSQKWKAALAVLASAYSAGAQYIDVSDPTRPAAGARSSSATGSNASAYLPAAGTSPASP